MIHALGSTFRQRTLPPLTSDHSAIEHVSIEPLANGGLSPQRHSMSRSLLEQPIALLPHHFQDWMPGHYTFYGSHQKIYPCSTARHAAHCRAADLCIFQTTRSFLLLRLLLTAPPGSQHMTPQSPLPFRPLSRSGVLLYRAVIKLSHRHR